jgi:hypothetical protein
MSVVRRILAALWTEDLDEAQRRLAALDLEAEVASARGRAMRWRWVEGFSGFLLPLPLVAQDVTSVEGAWLAEDADDRVRREEEVGFDAHGRPVMQLLDAGGEWARAGYVWEWQGDGSFVEIEPMASGPHVRVSRMVDGRLAHVACASRLGTLDVQLTAAVPFARIARSAGSPMTGGARRVPPRSAVTGRSSA